MQRYPRHCLAKILKKALLVLLLSHSGYAKDENSNAYFVEDEKLSYLERLQAQVFLSETGNSLENYYTLLHGSRGPRKTIQVDTGILFGQGVYRSPRFYEGNWQQRLPLSKMEELNRRAKEGEEFRKDYELKAVTEFLNDSSDPRVQVFQNLERVLALSPLLGLSPQKGEAPRKDYEVPGEVHQRFQKRFGRPPQPSAAEDAFELRKLYGKVESETVPATQLKPAFDFKKLKTSLLKRIKEAQDELGTNFISESKINASGKALLAYASKKPAAATRLFKELFLKELINVKHVDYQTVLERALQKGASEESIVSNIQFTEKGPGDDHAKLSFTIADGSKIEINPTGIVLAFLNSESAVRVVIDNGAKNLQSPFDDLFLFYLRHRAADVYEVKLKELQVAVSNANNSLELLQTVRTFKSVVAPSNLGVTVPLLQPHTSQAHHKLIHNIFWYGWKKEPKFWNKTKGVPRSLALAEMTHNTFQVLNSMRKNLPRQAVNAGAPALLAAAAIGMGQLIATGFDSDNRISFVASAKEKTKKAKDFTIDLPSRFKALFGNWGTVSVFSSDEAPKGNVLTNGEKEAEAIFRVERSEDAAKQNIYFAITELKDNTSWFSFGPTALAAKTTENVDAKIVSEKNIQTHKGKIIIPTPMTKTQTAELLSLELRDSKTGSVIDDVTVYKAASPGTYFIENSAGTLPKRITMTANFDFVDRPEAPSVELKPKLVKILAQKIREGGFLKIADNIDRHIASDSVVTFDELEKLISLNSIYAKHPELPFDSSRVNPDNPFTDFHQFIFDDTLCTTCNTGHLFYTLALNEYAKLYKEDSKDKIATLQERNKAEQLIQAKSLLERLQKKDLGEPPVSVNRSRIGLRYQYMETYAKHLSKILGLEQWIAIQEDTILRGNSKEERAKHYTEQTRFFAQQRQELMTNLQGMAKTLKLWDMNDPHMKRFLPRWYFDSYQNSQDKLPSIPITHLLGPNFRSTLSSVERFDFTPQLLTSFLLQPHEGTITANSFHASTIITQNGAIRAFQDATPRLEDPRPPPETSPSRSRAWLEDLNKKLRDALKKGMPESDPIHAMSKMYAILLEKMQRLDDIPLAPRKPLPSDGLAIRAPRVNAPRRIDIEENESETKSESTEPTPVEKIEKTQPRAPAEQARVTPVAPPLEEEFPLRIRLLHKDLEAWRSRQRDLFEETFKKLKPTIEKSGIRGRFGSLYAGEAQQVYVQSLQRLSWLASGQTTIDTLSINERGEVLPLREFSNRLRGELDGTEKKFFDELERFVRNPRDNPRRYPFAEAHKPLAQLFTDGRSRILGGLGDFPPALLDATSHELIQVSAYDMKKRPSSTSFRKMIQDSRCSSLLRSMTLSH